MTRRTLAKMIGFGAAAAPHGYAQDQTRYSKATLGLPPLKIRDVRTILTDPPYADHPSPTWNRLVVVKVETSEPGLYGLGCATEGFRPLAVVSAIENYLRPFVIGKDADQISDLWQSMNASSLWRSGPVLNDALSGVDMALWDIKGKRANMPVYELLGGKCRAAARCYADAAGRTPAECAEMVQRQMAAGFQHVRLNFDPPSAVPTTLPALQGMATDSVADPAEYVREIPKWFEFVRKICGDKVELMQHLHGELPPEDTINLIKRLEPHRPFFFEDPFLPEQVGYFRLLRQQCSVPIAMGEKFVNVNEYTGLVAERLIDYFRAHISTIGGFSAARRAMTLCEFFGVRTAWHAPRNVSPVGHAANLHLDLASLNFGIQEQIAFSPEVREVFPGTPVVKAGYLYANAAPGFGVGIDEKLAAKYPHRDLPGNFGPKRSPDGSLLMN